MTDRTRTNDMPRTYIEVFDCWRCPRCNVWFDRTFDRCDLCGHKQVHVVAVAYECQACGCIFTTAGMHLHDCGVCSL